MRIQILDHSWLRQPKFKGSGVLGVGGDVRSQGVLYKAFNVTGCQFYLNESVTR